MADAEAKATAARAENDGRVAALRGKLEQTQREFAAAQDGLAAAKQQLTEAAADSSQREAGLKEEMSTLQSEVETLKTQLAEAAAAAAAADASQSSPAPSSALDSSLSAEEQAAAWVREVFARADKDGNGILSKTELKTVLHQDEDLRTQFRAVGGRHWKDFWHELDVDGDGRISLDEMLQFFRERAESWRAAAVALDQGSHGMVGGGGSSHILLVILFVMLTGGCMCVVFFFVRSGRGAHCPVAC